MLIKVAGLDPSLRAWGLAKASYDVIHDTIQMTDIDLIETAIETGKTVRKSSDYLRRATLLHSNTHTWIAGCSAVFAEVPTGSQSASGAMSNGICVGVLSSIGGLIQVDPYEVKRAAVGSKNASKEEMIEWAMERYPNLPWLITKSGKCKGQPTAKNEHMADACAAISAGVATAEFRTIVQIVRSTQGQAGNLVSD